MMDDGAVVNDWFKPGHVIRFVIWNLKGKKRVGSVCIEVKCAIKLFFC